MGVRAIRPYMISDLGKVAHPIFISYVRGVSATFQLMITWLLILLSFYRYMAVCYPNYYEKLKSPSKAMKYFSVIAVVATLYYTPWYFQYKIKVLPNGQYLMLLKTYAEGLYDLLYNVIVFYTIYFIVPFSVLIFMSVKLIQTLRSLNQKRQRMTSSAKEEVDLTKMLVVIIIIFMICQTFIPLVRLIRALSTTEQFMACHSVHSYFQAIARIAITFNSAINFVIYYKFVPSFRKSLRKKVKIWPFDDNNATEESVVQTDAPKNSQLGSIA
jgi:hypothetical protein